MLDVWSLQVLQLQQLLFGEAWKGVYQYKGMPQAKVEEKARANFREYANRVEVFLSQEKVFPADDKEHLITAEHLYRSTLKGNVRPDSGCLRELVR